MSGPAVSARVRRRASRSRPTPAPRRAPAPTPPLCAYNAHVWRFVDRVQLGLPDGRAGGYVLVSTVACTKCVAVVEFVGVCDVIEGKTRLLSAAMIGADGLRNEIPLPANRVMLVPQG